MAIKEHFPSIFLVSSGHEAKWYRMEEGKAILLQHVKTPKVTYSDREGKARVGRGIMSRTGEPDKNTEKREEEEQALFKNILDGWKQKYRNELHSHFVLAVPKQFKHKWVTGLADASCCETFHYVEGNYLQKNPAFILSLFHDGLKPRNK
jgi:hypothetical protein